MQLPWRGIYSSKVPRKIGFLFFFFFFGRTTALGRIITVDYLIKRNTIVVDWCCMCKWFGECTDHLLLHCMVAEDLWSFLLMVCGVKFTYKKKKVCWVKWLMLHKVIIVYFCWHGRHTMSSFWNAAPLCLMWMIWKWSYLQLHWDVYYWIKILISVHFVWPIFYISHCFFSFFCTFHWLYVFVIL
jgi:hypothetical protein